MPLGEDMLSIWTVVASRVTSVDGILLELAFAHSKSPNYKRHFVHFVHSDFL